MKICTKCKSEFPATTEYWFKGKNCKDGLRSICKRCHIERNQKYRKNNQKEYEPHPEILKVCGVCGNKFPATTTYWFKSVYGKYGLRSICKSCFQAESKKNKDKPESKIKSREASKKHYAKNRAQFSERWKVYYQENAEHIKARSRKYGRENRDKLRISDTRRREDPQYRLCSNISRHIRQSLFEKRSKNGAHWEKIVGYTRQDLIEHLENKFKDGMSWENYGDWHLDHVTPKSVFNFTSYKHEDFKRCWALDNLQPLWAFDNISKSNKLEKPFQPSLAI